jgi:hydrogenase nickel incorporation protein HypA/HybF
MGPDVHELALSQAIVDTAVRHAEGRRVTSVQMRIGTLRQVVGDSLAFYFEIVSRDTVCEGATLDHELVAALLECRDCGQRWDPAPPPIATHGSELDPFGSVPTFRCPSCGTGGDVARGDEFCVESITVEEEEDACTAPR